MMIKDKLYNFTAEVKYDVCITFATWSLGHIFVFCDVHLFL